MNFNNYLALAGIVLAIIWIIFEMIRNNDAIGPTLDSILSIVYEDNLVSVSYKGRSTNFTALYNNLIVERQIVTKGEYYEQINFTFYINKKEVIIICSASTPMILKINKVVYHAPYIGFQNERKIGKILEKVNTVI